MRHRVTTIAGAAEVFDVAWVNGRLSPRAVLDVPEVVAPGSPRNGPEICEGRSRASSDSIEEDANYPDNAKSGDAGGCPTP
jgi:hypothetical protein